MRRVNPDLACRKEELERTFSIKEFWTILPRKRDRFRDLTHQLYDLCDMIVVLAVSWPRSRIEEVIAARYELENLQKLTLVSCGTYHRLSYGVWFNLQRKLHSRYLRSYPI